MILCSRRVYLNILTQLMDLEQLLNANYYIIDQSKPTGIANIDDCHRMNSDGAICYEPTLDFSQAYQSGGIHRYFIKYDTSLNPTPFVSIVSAGIKNDFSTPEERFASYLKQTDTQIAVYQFLFQDKLNGNGLQIMIMRDDMNIQRFGDIICCYLSQVFGADIKFIDPQYRPNTRGRIEYVGDKNYAKQHIMDLRDAMMLSAFEAMVSMSHFGDGMNNILQFLNPMDITQLIYLYNKLFPGDPLPPGNYTEEHIKKIIVGRVIDSTGQRKEMVTLSNLGVNFDAFDPAVEEYEQMIEEDFSGIS